LALQLQDSPGRGRSRHSNLHIAAKLPQLANILSFAAPKVGVELVTASRRVSWRGARKRGGKGTRRYGLWGRCSYFGSVGRALRCRAMPVPCSGDPVERAYLHGDIIDERRRLTLHQAEKVAIPTKADRATAPHATDTQLRTRDDSRPATMVLSARPSNVIANSALARTRTQSSIMGIPLKARRLRV
jgi:hypothetical protein